MRFQYRLPVAAQPDAVWRFFRQVERMAACIPGIEKVEPTGSGGYRAEVRDRVGPFHVRFPVDISVTWGERSCKVVVKGQDSDTQSHLHLEVAIDLVEEGRASVVQIDTTVQVTGRLGTLGQNVMSRVFEQKMAAFAKNLSSQLASGGPEDASSL